ncbi:hypothetical protein KPG66_15230 [Mycetohabitans sp. B2]|uniref:hypothetical protein n=1 Tax=Mycetohabitans sp. B2 TaxID=2841274 RepID=UPI001F23FB0D|nr:hypothetical protein [Mycetohabitans sp. B2]MCF7697341.1 hypothetical protein [Mycetohabitans sp. B2]
MAVAAAEELPHFSLACAAHEDEAPLSRAQFVNGVTIDMNYEQSKQFLFTQNDKNKTKNAKMARSCKKNDLNKI